MLNRSTFSFLLIIALVFSCQKVPLTGRQQFTPLPESQILSMSFQNYNQVLESSKLSNDQEEVQMIRRVGEKLASSVENYFRENNQAGRIDDFEWEFNLIEDDDMVNAWCMPGGKVAFYTGILPICEDEQGVATVMSHEIAHAIAKHGNERMAQQLGVQLGGMALSVALSEEPETTQQLAFAAFGLGTQYGLLLPYSRQHETEADEIGIYMMAMGGYDTNEAIDFWQRMAQQGGERPPEFMSTHPSPESRIEHIRKTIPKAEKYRGEY
ncbi:putative Zn-dependent protease [Catalinimonas alkaloidigena]|uniref:M48 family metallopeptidase n=1 Tax=Catalinimonas alkaloidigena TaxID=1075417 RepID=UPI0024076238|nr:M48 family metallopeptidase [Catalinimonas alkaloidigena]MDF9797685.1 putative Zn-dependent protease [Catalinimonas alkaloidigena]